MPFPSMHTQSLPTLASNSETSLEEDMWQSKFVEGRKDVILIVNIEGDCE